MSTSGPRQYSTDAPGTSRINVWLVVLLLGLTGVMIYRQAFWHSSLFNLNAESRAITPRGDLAADEISTIELFQQVSPSVVHVTSVAVLRDVFTMDVREMPAGTGSGFIWNTEGHIVTNLHVIRDGQGAVVTLADNSNHSARLVGFDTANDIAVLKIDVPAGTLTPISSSITH
jgi:S1-C subfamily serine protease